MKFEPKFNFYEVIPGIFLLEVDGNEDLAMTFLRAQEYYESANDNFRNHNFTLDEYKAWYKTQSKTGEFSYAEDWKGFNLPSSIIDKCYADSLEVLPTDDFLLQIGQFCEALAEKCNVHSYYLLGVRRGDTKSLEHEIAHGLYSTNESYRKKMDELIEPIDSLVKDEFFAILQDMGYGENVHKDEMQAWMATGLKPKMESPEVNALVPQFQRLFQSYVKGWKLPEPLIKKIKTDKSVQNNLQSAQSLEAKNDVVIKAPLKIAAA